MTRQVRKKDKICVVCGNRFKGTEGRFTCSNSCRTYLSRLVEQGKKPEYYEIAKGNKQKLPLLFKRPKKKEIEIKEPPNIQIQYMAETPASFDGEKASKYISDEIGLFPQPEPTKLETSAGMTRAQKLTAPSQIQAKIKIIVDERLPPGMPPKAHALNKSMRIDDLNDQIKAIEDLPTIPENN